jgi:hypothetical protein
VPITLEMGPRAATTLAVALLALLAPGTARSEIRRLSDETLISRWAHATVQGPVLAAPAAGARRVARLRHLTEDGLPEVYLALRRLREGRRDWVEVRIPGRPNGRTGWVRRHVLGPLHVVRTQLAIDRGRRRATLRRRGRVVWSAPVGIGAPGTPTPRGRFHVRERLVVGGGGGVYGPLAFGTSAYSVLSDWPGGGVIGIHGTDEPARIPGRVSHGCVRLRNADILRLGRLMPIGTPVRIR